MQERNDELEREVERFHQRRGIEQRVGWILLLLCRQMLILTPLQIEDIELLIPIQEMKESKVLYYETKAKQRVLHEVVTGLKDKNAPAHALLEYVSILALVGSSLYQSSMKMWTDIPAPTR